MSHDDDLDLWQADATKAPNEQGDKEPAPMKRNVLEEQRRADLQAITNLLARAAKDLRANERRALEAEARAAEAERLLAEAETRAAVAETRAAEAEARAAEVEEREKKINAQALRAFETMKEHIETSEAKAAEAHARAKAVEDRSNDAILQLEKRTSEIEKAAEERSFEFETRLEAAEMRIAAARRALGGDVAIATASGGRAVATEAAPAPAFAHETSEPVGGKVRH